jgi:hypothetical protein
MRPRSVVQSAAVIATPALPLLALRRNMSLVFSCDRARVANAVLAPALVDRR